MVSFDVLRSHSFTTVDARLLMMLIERDFVVEVMDLSSQCGLFSSLLWLLDSFGLDLVHVVRCSLCWTNIVGVACCLSRPRNFCFVC